MSLTAKSLAFSIGLIASLTTGAGAEHHKTIAIEGAYARVTSPNAKVGAIFLEIVNHAGAADRLVDAKSDVAARVQIHTHKENADGVMQMLHLSEGIAIQAESHHALKRGGDHVMLMGLHEGLEHGDTVPLTLVFEQAGEITLDVTVDLERKAQAGGHEHKSHDH